jgi:hypothetical protein
MKARKRANLYAVLGTDVPYSDVTVVRAGRDEFTTGIDGDARALVGMRDGHVNALSGCGRCESRVTCASRDTQNVQEMSQKRRVPSSCADTAREGVRVGCTKSWFVCAAERSEGLENTVISFPV